MANPFFFQIMGLALRGGRSTPKGLWGWRWLPPWAGWGWPKLPPWPLGVDEWISHPQGLWGWLPTGPWGWRCSKMWRPVTLCGQDGVASHHSLFIFCFYFFYFFNLSHGGLMALGSLRRDPSHQLAPLQAILDWRGAGSLLISLYKYRKIKIQKTTILGESWQGPIKTIEHILGCLGTRRASDSMIYTFEHATVQMIKYF